MMTMMKHRVLLVSLLCLYLTVVSLYAANLADQPPVGSSQSSAVALDGKGDAFDFSQLPSSSSSSSFSSSPFAINNEQPITEQDRVDTVLRIFRLLPPGEVEGLNLLPSIDLKGDTPILPGTLEAKALFEAWDQRQSDLSKAVNSMVKPVEHMAQIMQKLRSPDIVSNAGATIELLTELENNVGDVDNARDFHTIGGWPLLGEILDGSGRDLRVKGWTSWVIGTAVSNNYDYQLWTLERLSANITRSASSSEVGIEKKPTSVFDSLLRALQHPFPAIGVYSEEVDFLHKKAFYALAAAARGNPDVQAYAVRHTDLVPTINGFIQTFAGDINANGLNHTYVLEMARKTWGLVSDLLTERLYVHNELLKDVLDQNNRIHAAASVSGAAAAIAATNSDKNNSEYSKLSEVDSHRGQELINYTKIIDELHMLGDEFSNIDTLEQAAIMLQNLLYDSEYLASVKDVTSAGERVWWLSQLNMASANKHKSVIRNLFESLLSTTNLILQEYPSVVKTSPALNNLLYMQMNTLHTLLVDAEANNSIKQSSRAIAARLLPPTKVAGTGYP